MKGKRFLLLILSMSIPFAIGGKQSARAPRLGAIVGQTAKAFEFQEVLLIAGLNSSSFQIALGTPVIEDFCITFKTHYLGYSSYTWGESKAKELILYAGTGYTSTAPELHLFNKAKPTLKLPYFAFQHFHNFTSNGKRDERKPQVKCHSFFGPLFGSPNKDGKGEIVRF